MSETRGVFSIRELYGLKIEDKWINPEDTWLSPSPFYGESLNNGYFGGTNNPSFKMDFSNDSVSDTPSIPNNVYQVDYWSVGNQLFGYLAGNPALTPSISVIKITYSTSSSQLIPTISSLSTPSSYEAAAVGNETNGYVGTNNQQSLIHKITYSTDNVQSLPSGTSNYNGENWYRYATVGNTDDGYFIGGSVNAGPDPDYQTQIEKITYSTENFSNVTNTGIIRKSEQTVASGNNIAGYISGTQSDSASLMQKLTYSTEQASYIPGSGPPYVSFPGNRSTRICSSGNSTHGYFLGGNGNTTEYGKIDYTTDTLASNTFLPSSYNREQLQGLGPRDNALPSSNVLFPAPSGPNVNLFNQSENPNIGYFGGNNNVSKNRYNFADETVLLAPGAEHPNTRAKSGGNTTHAYHFGDGPASPAYSTYKTEYATDTTGNSSVATAPINYERRDHKVIGNQTDAYLFGNSNYNLGKTYYDKFTYSTDTFATSPFPKAVPIPASNNYESNAAAIGNQTHGYLTGGGPSTSSEIWRMVYSTDTIDSTPSANTQAPASNRRYCAGVGSGSAGYFCGGIPISSFEKFVYSNDTISSVPGLPLLSTNGDYTGGATGNSTHGYINTRYYSSNMSKITYSTDTSSVAEDLLNYGPENYNTGVGPRQFDLPFLGPLPPTPTPQYALGSFPISNNGYFMGSPGSNPNKISFTDDSVSPVTTLSSHSSNNNSAGQLQNSAYGYDIRETSSQPDSKKIYFNIETDFLIPSITNSDVREGAKGSGNSTDGYLLGQQGSNGSNNVDKLQYSTDTLSPLPVAPIVMGKHAAAGNSTHGYFAGGVSGNSILQSHIQRIIYSTDTTESVPSVNLSVARESFAAAGNDTHGYFVGGDPANKTTVDRITYATNTGDVSSINMYPNTSLTPGENGSIATGNSTHGYFNMSGSRLYKLEYTTSTSAPFPNLMTYYGSDFFPSSFISAFSAKENGFPQTGDINQFGPVNL